MLTTVKDDGSSTTGWQDTAEELLRCLLPRDEQTEENVEKLKDLTRNWNRWVPVVQK